MPRSTRTYAPGVGYHVVAVTQGKAHWFTDDIKRTILQDINLAAAACGHRVLASVVMPNHFHIILKHGPSPLAWMMQRVMQRASIRVQKEHSVKGHVFGQRYWADLVPTAKYLRRAIVYTHLNPCKALMSDEPSSYMYSSHNVYLALAREGEPDAAGHKEGLMLFADESVEMTDVVQNYLRFVNFCQQRRRAGISGDWLLPGSAWFDDAPVARHGDNHWIQTFSQAQTQTELPKRVRDVSALAIVILRKIDPKLDLDMIRYGRRWKLLADPRRQLICGLLTAGCRPSGIARCLRVSPSLVSRIATQMRFAAAQQQ